MNAIQTAFDWLRGCLLWFFPETFLADPLVSMIINFFLLAGGLWFLSAIIFKPIVELFKGVKGWVFR